MSHYDLTLNVRERIPDWVYKSAMYTTRVPTYTQATIEPNPNNYIEN